MKDRDDNLSCERSLLECMVPVYQVYQEDQDQISGATYISDVVFYKLSALCVKTHVSARNQWLADQKWVFQPTNSEGKTTTCHVRGAQPACTFLYFLHVIWNLATCDFCKDSGGCFLRTELTAILRYWSIYYKVYSRGAERIDLAKAWKDLTTTSLDLGLAKVKASHDKV